MGAASVIGLNIGNATICAVEVRAAGGGYEVMSLGIVPTPEGTVMGGTIADPEAVGAVVKDLLAQCGAKTKQCVSSVAGQTSLVVRVIDVPRMSKKELDDMMKFELERHIPFQANEVILDYKPIERPHDDPASANMEVLLAAAQEEMINSHVTALEKAGLHARAVDIEPLAAARVLVDMMGGPDETVALLNIGAGSSEISVVRDGMLAFTRAVPLGGDSITQAIQDMFQVTRPQAERIKKEVGDALPDMSQPGAGGFAQPDYDTQAYAPSATTESAMSATPAAEPMSFGAMNFEAAPAAAGAATPDLMSFDLDAAVPTPFAPPPSAPALAMDFGDAAAPAETAPAANAFSFDLDLGGGPAEPGAPPGLAPSTAPAAPAPAANPFSFDLDDGASFGAEPVAEPAPAGSAFDLSFEEPAAPAPAAGGFDLSFDSPAPAGASPASPYDLSLGETPAPPAPSPFDLSVDAPAPPAATSAGMFSMDQMQDLGFALPTEAPAAAMGDFPAAPVDSSAMLPEVEGAPGEYGSVELAPADDLGVSAADVYNTVVPVLVELAGETRRSLEYFTGKFPDIPITRMVLFGGGARLRNLDVFMQNELGIRTTVSNPFTHMKVSAAGVSEAYLHELGPALTVAIGLALRDMLAK